MQGRLLAWNCLLFWWDLWGIVLWSPIRWSQSGKTWKLRKRLHQCEFSGSGRSPKSLHSFSGGYMTVTDVVCIRTHRTGESLLFLFKHCSSGPSEEYLWPFLADDLGTVFQSRYHAQQSDWKGISEYTLAPETGIVDAEEDGCINCYYCCHYSFVFNRKSVHSTGRPQRSYRCPSKTRGLSSGCCQRRTDPITPFEFFNCRTQRWEWKLTALSFFFLQIPSEEATLQK